MRAGAWTLPTRTCPFALNGLGSGARGEPQEFMAMKKAGIISAIITTTNAR